MGHDTRSRMPLFAAILLVVVGGGVVATSGWFARTTHPAAVRAYAPGEDVPRIRFEGDPVDAIMVRDFDVLDGELYLLDVSAPRVIVLADSAGVWRTVRSFGRAGQGPGELSEPSGMAVLPVTGEVVIADNAALHRFRRTGEYIGTRHPGLPIS